MSYEEFLQEWNDFNPSIELKTSGSTGIPKKIMVEKARMLASARITCDFLGLKDGDTALLCLPLDYIAGKMMVVRSIERNLKLVTTPPSSHPLKEITDYIDFCAMVPMQVRKSLDDPIEASRLASVRHLIIGGSAIDQELANRLRSLPNNIWSTYGMTETLSHIALRRLNGSNASEWYQPLNGVSIRLTDDSCLVINAPAVCTEELITNDIAEINSEGQFRILGRKDNVINTGGIKVQAEEIEHKIINALPELYGKIAITSKLDNLLGERIVLVTEKEIDAITRETFNRVIASLPKYHQPKEITAVSTIPLTETGKISRSKLRRLINE